jgi:hypothetical protein
MRILCDSLTNPDFTGLSSLTTVGDRWMGGCTALINPTFAGLSFLRRVGVGWMSSCKSLVDPDFTGTSHTAKLGDGGFGLGWEVDRGWALVTR